MEDPDAIADRIMERAEEIREEFPHLTELEAYDLAMQREMVDEDDEGR